MGEGEVVSVLKLPKTRMCSTGATWFGSTSMNGTAGEASETMIGPAQTASTISHHAAGREILIRTGTAIRGRVLRVTTYAPAIARWITTSSPQPHRPTLPSRKTTIESSTTAAEN